MTKELDPRDWEATSAYIDDELSPQDRARFEARLNAEPELRSLLEDLKRTRTLVRSLEPVRAPRNFSLTPEMAGVETRRFWPAAAFQYASAFAAVLFVLVIAGDFLGVLIPRQLTLEPSQAAFEQVEAEALPALTEQPLEFFLEQPEEDPAFGADESPLDSGESARIEEEENYSKAATAAGAPAESDQEQEPASPLEEAIPEPTAEAEAEPDTAGTEPDAPPLLTRFGLRVVEISLATVTLLLAIAAVILRRRVV